MASERDIVDRLRQLVDDIKLADMGRHPYYDTGAHAETAPQRTFWQTSLYPSYTKSNVQWDQDQRRLRYVQGVQKILADAPWGVRTDMRKRLGLGAEDPDTEHLSQWYYYLDHAPWSAANRMLNATTNLTKPLYNLGSETFDNYNQMLNLDGLRGRHTWSPDAASQRNAWANNVFGDGYQQQYRDFLYRDYQRPMFDLRQRSNMDAPLDRGVVDFGDEIRTRFPDSSVPVQIAAPMVMDMLTDPFMPYGGGTVRQAATGLLKDAAVGAVPTAGVVAASLLSQPSMDQLEAAEAMQMLGEDLTELNRDFTPTSPSRSQLLRR